MKRVLVTGGSGIIGSYLRRALEPQFELTCFSRTEPVEPWHHWVAGDVEQPDALRAACTGQDAVIHLAGVPGPGRATPPQLLQTNVIGSANALEAAVATTVGRFVLASSGAATGYSFQRRDFTPSYLPLDEEHPCHPEDEYGLSKLLAELTCKRYSDRYGITTACLRINHNWCVDRAGAEVATRAGWAGRAGLTVERLWRERYLKAVRDAAGEWPTSGPPAPHQLLWAVTDVRDAAAAFALALTADLSGHQVLHINGADTCSHLPTEQLLARHFPRVPLRAALTGFDSLVSCARAKAVLGFTPQHSWRQSDFADWLAQQPETTR